MPRRALITNKRLVRIRRPIVPFALLVFLSCAATVATGFAMASAPVPRVATQGLFPPALSFQLPASNGYRLSVVGKPPLEGHPASVVINVSAKNKLVVYSAPGAVTETSIKADLGDLGEISVNFQRSVQGMPFSCESREMRRDSGSYVGTIDFRGEEGFTRVDAATAPGSVEYSRGAGCGLNQELVGHSVGEVMLRVHKEGLGPQMSVRSSRPDAPARVWAFARERNHRISIERSTSMRIAGRDFTYDRFLRTATLHPPAPFAGSGRFDRSKEGRRWSGDLSVDLPGRSDVSLTSRSLRASLVRFE
jgi:hypothetical protein